MVALVSSFATPPLSVLNPLPVPLNAEINDLHTEVTVAFSANVNIFGSPADDAFVRHDDDEYSVEGETLEAPQVIVFDIAFGDANIGDDKITWSNANDTIRDDLGRTLDSFDIPLSAPSAHPVSCVYDQSDSWIDITFAEAITLNSTVKQNFDAYAGGFVLTVQSVSQPIPTVVRLGISIDGPTGNPDSLVYSQPVNGMAGVNEVPVHSFDKAMTVVP